MRIAQQLIVGQCCDHKKHVVMINVEADVLAGPLLARKAKEAEIIYSMAYGDQPALIAELVDWARTSGLYECSSWSRRQYQRCC